MTPGKDDFDDDVDDGEDGSDNNGIITVTFT